MSEFMDVITAGLKHKLELQHNASKREEQKITVAALSQEYQSQVDRFEKVLQDIHDTFEAKYAVLIEAATNEADKAALRAEQSAAVSKELTTNRRAVHANKQLDFYYS